MSTTHESIERGDLLTVQQALKIVPVSKSLIYNLCEEGVLAHRWFGRTKLRRGRLLLWRDSLEEYVRSAPTNRRRPPEPQDDSDDVTLDDIRREIEQEDDDEQES